MSFNKRFRFNDKESGFPISPYLGKQDPEKTVPISKTGAFDVSFLHGELLTKGHIFKDKIITILENQSENPKEKLKH